MKVTDFELVKGMSNQYWGWGMEDDEFYHRLKEARLEVRRPEGIKTGTEDTFLHIHGPRKHARDFQGGQTGFSLNTLHIGYMVKLGYVVNSLVVPSGLLCN